jgi:hypothetical protein
MTGRAEFRRTRAGLLAAAFLAPFSATHLVGPLTLGRAAAIAFAVLLASDLIRHRPRRFQPDMATILLVVGYVGLCGWVFLSAAALGCNCEGKAGGLFEFTVVGLLAVVAIGFEPRLRGPALVVALGGLVLAAALALSGVGSLNSGTVDLTQTGGRLSGTYGNANELGLAAALGIPVALAYISVAGRAARLAVAASIAILVVTFVLTYSRGGIIAAGVGVVALALWEARRSRRRVGLILAGTLLAVAVSGILYSVFKEHRESASFESVPSVLKSLDQRDVSGWDTRALGPIPNGPSRIENGTAGIAASRGQPGEGVSFRWGEADAGTTYVLRLKAMAASGVRISYALGDKVRGGGSMETTRLDGRWRSLSLVWRPQLRSPQATLFVWRRGAGATFDVSDVRVIAHDPSRGTRVIAIPDQLQGSIYDHLISTASRSEERYVRSRLDAARLAFRAFRSAPLQGIGWSTFPIYSSERLDYGRLAAHDQYLLIAAELGLVGLVFLALLLAAPVVGARGAPAGRPTAAAIGLLCSAAAGMIFVETVAAPQLSIPIAVAAAVLCARIRGDQRERTMSRISTPPPKVASARN